MVSCKQIFHLKLKTQLNIIFVKMEKEIVIGRQDTLSDLDEDRLIGIEDINLIE